MTTDAKQTDKLPEDAGRIVAFTKAGERWLLITERRIYEYRDDTLILQRFVVVE